MKDTKNPYNDNDLLNSRIDALLNNEGISEEASTKSPDMDALLSIAKKVVSQAEEYQSGQEPSPQQRLEIMTAFRTEMKNTKQTDEKRNGFFLFFQNTTIRWAAAVGAAILVTVGLLLSTPAGGSTVLPGAAGHLNDVFPLILLVLILIVVVFYLIFRRKK